MIVTLLNEGFAPPVRRLGSIGQGDLGPMADLAHGLITRSGFEVAENELSPRPWSAATPSPRPGPPSPSPIRRPDVGVRRRGCPGPGGLRGQPDLPAPGHRADPALPRPGSHAGGAAEAAHRQLPRQPGAARFLQDPLTFRCLPHINRAAPDALAYPGTILQLQLNSSQSNPVVVVPERRIVSVGNFDIGPLAAALDFARIALAPVVTSANGRVVKLLQAPYSGLAAGRGRRGLARRRAVRAGGGRPGDHRRGPHAGPSRPYNWPAR